jgi:hypothetical protein
MTNLGPYDTEQDAWAADLPVAVEKLYAGATPTVGAVRRARFEALMRACFDADVGTGEYDDKILRWLSGWEDATVQVVIGLIGRAYESGKTAAKEG